MQRLVWLDSAVDDVVRFKKFIARENPGAAKRAATAIKNTAQRLTELPESGKPVKEPLHYRDISIRFGAGGYILRYRVYQDTIYMVHVRHYRESDFKM